jgi:NAD(P)-dependent dehydrogenase (short-subunit alcohol dehydrogenase family)
VPGKADGAAHQANAIERTLREFGSVDMLVNNAVTDPVFRLTWPAPSLSCCPPRLPGSPARYSYSTAESPSWEGPEPG